MRLIDLARPYLDDVTTIVEAVAGDLDLGLYLGQLDGVTHLRTDPQDWTGDPAAAGDGTAAGKRQEPPPLGKNTLLVISAGPDPARHLPFGVCRQVLEHVLDGGRGLVLFGYPSTQLPYHQILDTLVTRDCQVLQAATLDYEHLRCGIAFTRTGAAATGLASTGLASTGPASTGEVQAPRDYFGRPVPGARYPEAALRIANEYVLADFVSRGLRARVADLERSAGRHAGDPGRHAGDRGEPAGLLGHGADEPAGGQEAGTGEPGQGAEGRVEEPGEGIGAQTADSGQVASGGTGAPAEGQVGVARLAVENAQLARTLRDAQARLAGSQARLASIEHSATMELGRAIVTAARRPWRGGARLPRDLYRLWRARGAGQPASNGSSPGTVQTGDAASPGDRFLAAYTTPGHGLQVPGSRDSTGSAGQLVITGVLTARSCATLGPDAIVHPLLPHDAEIVLEGVGADLVIIEAAATLPGSAWSYAGDPAAADRGKRLVRLIAAAGSLGKPVVFLRNTPSYLTPGLDWLTAACDVTFDGDLGVQLARFNPVDLPVPRSCDAVYAGPRDPREPPALRRMLDELIDGGRGPVRLVDPGSWRAAPSWYRQQGLFVTGSAAQAREQLACGARVIGPAGDEELVHGATAAADFTGVIREIEAARGSGPRDLAEIRPVLRELFEAHATPARLTEIARLAGLSARTMAGGVPGRQVAVLAELRDAAEARGLADSLLRQRLRPAEAVVSVVPAAAARAAGARAAGAAGAQAGRAATGPVSGDAAEPAEASIIAALGELAESGMTIRTASRDRRPGAGPSLPGAGQPGAGQPGADLPGASLRWAARAAASPWVVPWTTGQEYPDTYLLDLVCARECSRADAVGHAPGDDYVFTQMLAPALARRDLFGPDGPPADAWGRRGLTLFSISR